MCFRKQGSTRAPGPTVRVFGQGFQANMAPAGFLWLPTCSEHRPAVCALFGKKHGPGRAHHRADLSPESAGLPPAWSLQGRGVLNATTAGHRIPSTLDEILLKSGGAWCGRRPSMLRIAARTGGPKFSGHMRCGLNIEGPPAASHAAARAICNNILSRLGRFDAQHGALSVVHVFKGWRLFADA